MELSNSIATMATAMKSAQLAHDVSTSMMKKSMDVQKDAMAGMLEALNAAAPKFAGDNGFLFDAIA